jgi:DNA-binding MarR family transcriptional regulator
MAIAPDEASGENARITLGLLDSVERGDAQSQRRLAAELGIALGLVNAYLKRCIKKGLVKVNEAPARRYAYYLTPQGFAEKSRLTVEYLSHSFGFFRQAKSDCSQVLGSAADKGFQRVVLTGRSDLAEIAAICALDHGVAIVAVVDAAAGGSRFAGLVVYPGYDEVPTPFDAVLITDLVKARETTNAAVARFGADRVLIPELLRVRIGEVTGMAAS